MSSPATLRDDAALSVTKRSTVRKEITIATCFLFLTAASGISAYYHALTEFAPWDDEGTALVMVRHYLAGVKLYARPSLPWGPVYFFYNWLVRTISGTPETHDIIRMSELLPWLLTAFLAAWIIFRLTSSIGLACLGHVLVFLLLWDSFFYEAGHPQELCILLLVSLAAAGVVAAMPKWRFFGLASAGALTAALLLVKINIGVFAILAATVAISAHSPKTKLSRLAFYASGAASLVLPVVLMRTHLRDWPTLMYAILVLISTMAALLVLVRVPRARDFTLFDSVAAGGAFVISFLIVMMILKIQGVLLSQAVHALLLDILGPLVVHSIWYIPLRFKVGHEWLLWIIAGPFVAGYFSRSLSEQHRESSLAALKFLLGFLMMVDALFSIYPTLYPFGLVPDFFFLAPPFCWLLLYWNSDGDRDSNGFARTLLCILAILQMLYAYPIAGAQVTFAEVLPAVVLIVCLSDSLTWQRKRLGRSVISVARALSPIALVCAAVFYLALAQSARNRYDALPSLQLPGAGRIHLQAAQAEDYHWLVSQLDSHCDVFVGLPEAPSLHIWTGRDPVSGTDMSDWMMVMSDKQEAAVSALLSQHPNACAVYNQQLVDFWNQPRRDLSSLPLVNYITNNFKVVGRAGPFSLMVKNDRDLEVKSIR